MTFAQIGSIIALLLAFGVNQPTADKVQGILNASVPPIVDVSQGTTTPNTVVPSTDNTPIEPVFGSIAQSAPTPDHIQVITNSPRAQIDPFIFSVSPILSDGTVDNTAVLIATSTWLGWESNFKYGIYVCNGSHPEVNYSTGCHVKIGESFNTYGMGPIDSGTFTFTVSWYGTNISTTTTIVVQ